MPQFEAGQSKTARVRMKNPTGKAFNYSSAIYLSLMPVSEKLFSLGAGEEKDVLFPVVMPDMVGAHPVHLSVHSEDRLLALYQATEGVTISPVGINLGDIKLLSVEGQNFSAVGPGYGVLANTLVRPSLSGLSIVWNNVNRRPSWYPGSRASNEFDQWWWWLGFEPQFETGYREEPSEGEEPTWVWVVPAHPTFMNRASYRDDYPAIGNTYQVNINGLHSGGQSIPGLYDGLFRLMIVRMEFPIIFDVEWRVKNMVRVTG